MPEKSSVIPLTQNRMPSNNDMVDPKKIISLIRSNKYIFIGTLFSALLLAFLYNTFTLPVYKVSASILIEEDKKSIATGNDQLLEGFGLMPGSKNLDNQIMVLTSRTLVHKTLDELALDTAYYYRRLFMKKSFYPLKPIRVIAIAGSQLPEDVEFTFKYLGNDMFRIDAKSDDSFEIHKKASFGWNIELPGGIFQIVRNDAEWSEENENRKLYFIFNSRHKLVEDYIERLKISPVTKKGTIVKISLEGTNKIEDLAFLDKLTDEFVNISLRKKNSEAIRTIQFIDDQLTGISDSLVITESKLQKFRTTNKVMNLSSQGQVIIDQVMKLENEKARLGMEAKYFDYLTNYLEKEPVGEVPIAPATMGIVDPGLTRLVGELADLQGKLYSKGMGDKNPLYNQLSQQGKRIKEALKETLKGLKGANELAIKENQDQLNAINDQASALPRTERQLLGIERKYKLNDELYTFLLEKRAIAQMRKASNVADNEIIDYPEFDNKPVSPRKYLIYFFALLTGAGFPFLWILFSDMFNSRIKDLDEIKKITDTPCAGHIPHIIMKNGTILFTEPDSEASEAFRLLRSRMKFFIKENKAPVILITSSMPDEGKTTVSVNLALAYSLLGKKTILIGFDLRQPKIFSDFDVDNNKGVSTWLIGKDKLPDIIKATSYSNLSIISSGPVPPNPSELISLNKTEELIGLLKERYDYIIIDSSPVGIVSDTLQLFSIADVCIMVVRLNHTVKDLFDDTINDIRTSNLKSLSLVINDVMPNGRSYGYRGRYRYGYKPRQGEKVGRKNLFSKIGKHTVKMFI
jgi:tyrosine-protein kinase Etk/Wzc